jgi:hypothetical protein
LSKSCITPGLSSVVIGLIFIFLLVSIEIVNKYF